MMAAGNAQPEGLSSHHDCIYVGGSGKGCPKQPWGRACFLLSKNQKLSQKPQSRLPCRSCCQQLCHTDTLAARESGKVGNGAVIGLDPWPEAGHTLKKTGVSEARQEGD